MFVFPAGLRNALPLALTGDEVFDGPRYLYVGTTGAVKVLDMSDREATFTNVPSGSIVPVVVKKVFQVGTDATDIVAVW